jgi:hypothetical protein
LIKELRKILYGQIYHVIKSRHHEKLKDVKEESHNYKDLSCLRNFLLS